MPLSSRLRLETGRTISLAELDTFITVAKHRGATQRSVITAEFYAAVNEPGSTDQLTLTIEVPEV